MPPPRACFRSLRTPWQAPWLRRYRRIAAHRTPGRGPLASHTATRFAAGSPPLLPVLPHPRLRSTLRRARHPAAIGPSPDTTAAPVRQTHPPPGPAASGPPPLPLPPALPPATDSKRTRL